MAREQVIKNELFHDGKGALMHWGVGETDFCKNVEYNGCTLSRFDAHQGLYNGKIINSELNIIALTGMGEMIIENSTQYSLDPSPEEPPDRCSQESTAQFESLSPSGIHPGADQGNCRKEVLDDQRSYL